jgi:hyaluronan synthase
VTLTVLTSTLSMCLRQQRHLEQVPSDVFRMPFFVMFSTLVLMPIRMVGFVRLAHQGSWGTRENAYDSGDSGPAVDDVLHGAPPGPGGSAATSGPPLEAAVVGSVDPGRAGVALVPPPAASSPPVASGGRALPNVRALLPIVLALIMVVGGTLYDARPT